MSREEEIIIEGVNRKDEKLWRMLFQRFFSPLCVFVSKMNLPDDVTEDIVQEVFISVWEGKRLFTGMRELTNYLYRACYNNALLAIHNIQVSNDALTAFFEEQRQDEDTFYRSAVKEELLRRMYMHIDALPTEQRRMILLRIEGKSWDEIAQCMGISINTVKTQRSRMFKTLRKKWEEEK